MIAQLIRSEGISASAVTLRSEIYYRIRMMAASRILHPFQSVVYMNTRLKSESISELIRPMWDTL